MTNTATDKTLIDALALGDKGFVDDLSASNATLRFNYQQVLNLIEANTTLLAKFAVAQEWTKTQNFNATSLTSTSNSIAWDAESNQVTRHIAAENTTLANPTNLKDGAIYIFTFIQHASSAKTLAFGSVYKFPGGIAPTVSTGASAVDILKFVSDGTNMHGVPYLNFS